MITVEIPKKELLRQLPQMAGYAIIQWLDEMPDKFVFEALPIQSREEQIEAEAPEVKAFCTPKEWALFMALYKRGKVNHSTLLATLGFLEERSFIPNSNNLAVHVKSLRKKLKPTKWRILSHRPAFNIQGRYQLIEFNS